MEKFSILSLSRKLEKKFPGILIERSHGAMTIEIGILEVSVEHGKDRHGRKYIDIYTMRPGINLDRYRDAEAATKAILVMCAAHSRVKQKVKDLQLDLFGGE